MYQKNVQKIFVDNIFLKLSEIECTTFSTVHLHMYVQCTCSRWKKMDHLPQNDDKNAV